MRIISVFFVAFLLNVPSELGVGIIEVDVQQTKEIRVFRNKSDEYPEKIIELLRGEDGEIIIKNASNEKWFIPELLSLDYSQLLLRYTKLHGDWIEIISNKETGEKKWLLKTDGFAVVPWDRFLKEKITVIEPLHSADIKNAPDPKSKTIRKSSEQDCFEILDIMGDWIKIKTSEGLECSSHPEPLKSGWIKWKLNNELLIEYYTTC